MPSGAIDVFNMLPFLLIDFFIKLNYKDYIGADIVKNFLHSTALASPQEPGCWPQKQLFEAQDIPIFQGNPLPESALPAIVRNAEAEAQSGL